MTIMDVNPYSSGNVMEKHHVQWLIHGHTHRPDVHVLVPTANRLTVWYWARGTAKDRW